MTQSLEESLRFASDEVLEHHWVLCQDAEIDTRYYSICGKGIIDINIAVWLEQQRRIHASKTEE